MGKDGHLETDPTYSSIAEKSTFLKSYVQTYLQEEIIAEQIIRKLPPVRRFLQVAAQKNVKNVNFTKIANEISSESSTVKFYLFDTGVVRAQAQVIDIGISPQTYDYGRLFESWLVSTIRALLEYKQKQYQLSYLRTKDNAENHLIIERAAKPTYCIEIKSGTTVRNEELGTLKSLSAGINSAKAVCLYQGTQELIIDTVLVLPWRKGLVELGLV